MKIQKISEITATLPFTEYDFMQKYRESFRKSELGRIRAKLPLKELAEKLIPKTTAVCQRGRKPLFPAEGERIIGAWRGLNRITGGLVTLTAGRKENRRVEFGAKVNCIQIDGISFIEHLSFEAFNEGTRLGDCIPCHRDGRQSYPYRSYFP